MPRLLIGIAALLLLIHAPARAADYGDSIVMNGVTRGFLIHIPDAAPGGIEGLPAVIVLHGGGGNAAQVEKQVGMDAVADKNGFVTVYPEGTSSLIGNFRTWNAGLCCGTAVKKKVDDVGFISAMIDLLTQKYGVDPRRVYATGHSNGAMMSYRLACELSDKIAAIAPNSGQRVYADCHPAHAVPVLHIHGTADPCALYDGGAQCGGCFSEALGISLPNDKWPCRPVKDVVEEHAKMNGCSDKTEVVLTKGAVTCTRYTGCKAPVELCSIKGGGHRWPGSTDTGSPSCKEHPDRRSCTRYANIVGPLNSDINAGEVMWEFFKDIKLP